MPECPDLQGEPRCQEYTNDRIVEELTKLEVAIDEEIDWIRATYGDREGYTIVHEIRGLKRVKDMIAHYYKDPRNTFSLRS